MSELVYWIWLSLACTPDTSTFPKLIEKFGNAKGVYDADEQDVSRCVGHRNSDRAALLNKELDRARGIFAFCTKHNVGILTYADERYPAKLREISSPPVLLYYRGVLPDFDRGYFVACVGTRSLSDYGRRCSFKISYDLAMAGATVVSGMAIGIDGVSLAGALAGGGITVAVLGSGIDVCYPMQHRTLAREIVKRGCVLTEYAPGTQPSKLNFPKRNRIISGLCASTVVFEGRERSGALITARYAKEQERTVYALPASVGTKHSEVSNLLIKNGAKLCTSAEDIINDNAESYRGVLNPFLLPKTMAVNMMDALRALEVVAICQGDDVFTPAYTKIVSRKNDVAQEKREASEQSAVNVDSTGNAETVEPPPNFDKAALEIYKKIPITGQCSIESLTDSDTDMRAVMRALLKLEMNKLAVLLPGDMVSRKSK